MHLNSIRVVGRTSKDLRIDVDATSFVELLRSRWIGDEVSPDGIDYAALRLDVTELAKTLTHVQAGDAAASKFTILNCTCGVPQCAGVRPFVVKRQDNVVRWTIQGASRDLQTIELAFDWTQYDREISKLARAH